MVDGYEIYLRPLRVEDAKVSYRWRNNPEVWKNTASAPDREVTVEMERAWIQKVLEDPSDVRFAICLKTGDRYIGNAYLTGIANGVAEEQIFIGEPSFWGHGIGTAARAALYEIATLELGLMRIVSNIRVRNVASVKSVLKLGFREVSRDAEFVKLVKILRGGVISKLISSYKLAA